MAVAVRAPIIPELQQCPDATVTAWIVQCGSHLFLNSLPPEGVLVFRFHLYTCHTFPYTRKKPGEL